MAESALHVVDVGALEPFMRTTAGLRICARCVARHRFKLRPRALADPRASRCYFCETELLDAGAA